MPYPLLPSIVLVLPRSATRRLNLSLSRPARLPISSTGPGSLTITSGGGNNSIAIDPVTGIFTTAIQGNVNITGAAGTDTLFVGDPFDTVGVAYTVTGSAILLNGVIRVTYSGIEGL